MNIKEKLFLIPLALLVTACGVNKLQTTTQTPNKKPTTALINFQQRKNYTFNNGKIAFNNQFDGARLNQITQENDSTFKITIEAENTPINSSPWYAFKIWASSEKNIYIDLNYPTTVHRYDPKIKAGKNWVNIQDIKLSTDKKTASFKLKVGQDTTLLSAQEIMTSTDGYKWEDSLVNFGLLKKRKIGQSILGKPINVLTTPESDGKKLIVVLSRQHPPEVTGYMAMQEFVKTITANSALATAFRKKYQLVLIPLLNPDGVDEGNWRHSVAGVDLNRDWELFAQPETKAVKDYLLRKIENNQVKVYFGIDFHSTYKDVFYTNEDQTLNQTNMPGFTIKWLNALKDGIPNFKPNIKPSPNGGNVSKSWMGRVLHAEALTYEVGDDTPRDRLKLIGRVAAEKMMELLLVTDK